MADFEFFKREFEFKGKHARMVSEMWISNDYEHTYFRRLIDLYTLAAIIGFRVDRNVDEDYSPFDSKSIFPEQMIRAKENLDFIMQMIIMMDLSQTRSEEESVKTAFRGPQTKEEYDYWSNRFNGYVRGGVEELYERLIIHKPDPDEEFHDLKTANLMSVINKFTIYK